MRTAIDTHDVFKNLLLEGSAAFGTRHPVRLAFVLFFNRFLAPVRSLPHLLEQFLIFLKKVLVFLAITELSHLISDTHWIRSLFDLLISLRDRESRLGVTIADFEHYLINQPHDLLKFLVVNFVGGIVRRVIVGVKAAEYE